jgi:pilus assembly protein CpaC
MRTLRRLAIFVLMVMPPAFSSGRVAAAGEPVVAGTEQILLLVGRSAVIHTDRAIQRVSVSTPEIADALVTAPRELLVHAKTPGTISLLVWSDNGRITNYEVIVRRDLTPLEGQIRRQFPNEPIAVAVNGKDVVLSGVVSAKHVIDRTAALAAGYVDKPENIVNLLRQTESPLTNQVMLQVRFAEVGRSAMQELGVSFFTGPNGKGDWVGRTSTQQYPAPTFDQDRGLVFSDFLNLFVFNLDEQLGAAIRALKGKGLFESLAEPNLITQDGKEASFLAGGEYPYPVVQGGGANQTVTIVFKEFGVRLRFTPTITGAGLVHLKVAPEVSTLDFANAVILEGFRIPALKTRRTETEVELRDGQTFAIAGLMDRNMDETLRRIPGIGDIPILGYLFRSSAYQKNNTELVVMITPRIVRRDSPGVTPNLPGLSEPFLPQPTRTIPMPAPAFSGGVESPAAPTRTVVSNNGSASAPVSNVTTANTPAPHAAPVGTAVSDADRRAAERAKREIERLEREQAERDRKAAAIEAARAAEEDKKKKKELDEARRVDAVRQEREKKLEAKRLEEQAAIDRKRWLEQQEQAEKAKAVADKLAKEQARRDAETQRIENERLEEERKIAEKHQKAQEKLAREQASRNDELEKLITQYKRLTGEKP